MTIKDDGVIDLSNSFSFSFANDVSVEVEEYKYLKDQLAAEKKKTANLLKQINNFLEKLKSDPDKPMINWPNRVEDVSKFQEKLIKLTKEK